MAERDPTFSYLRLTSPQRLFLIALITGEEEADICETLPHRHRSDRPDVGISPDTVRAWRHRNPDFKRAYEKAYEEPMWVAVNIGLPMIFAQQLKADVHVMAGLDAPPRKPYLNAKRLELMSQQLGLSSLETSPQGRAVAHITASINLVNPALNPPREVIDLTPVEHLPWRGTEEPT